LVEEIRLHGMGGQGVVACGELIAIAASYEDKFCRAFPMYGSARRGAPVLAFAQIGREDEATRSLLDRGVVVYNTTKTPAEAKTLFKKDIRKLGVVDATGIAVDVIGRPIPNTTILGAFAKTTGLLKMDSIFKAIEKRFPPRLAEPNKETAQAGYDRAQVEEY
jgi:2-oxoisovalerate ferredoxin oxidoreductase gamma subunit